VGSVRIPVQAGGNPMRPGFRLLLFWLLALVLPAGAALSQGSAVSQAEALGLDHSFQEVKAQNKIALVIGAEQYDYVGKLKYTSKDADDFKKYLVNSWGFSAGNVYLLTDQSPDRKFLPTQRNIEHWTDLVVGSVKPDTHVVIFYSGHGVRQKDQDWMVP